MSDGRAPDAINIHAGAASQELGERKAGGGTHEHVDEEGHGGVLQAQQVARHHQQDHNHEEDEHLEHKHKPQVLAVVQVRLQ
jgi:hypothetical protein